MGLWRGPRLHAKFTHHRKLYLMGSMDGISSNKFRKRIIMCEFFLKMVVENTDVCACKAAFKRAVGAGDFRKPPQPLASASSLVALQIY